EADRAGERHLLRRRRGRIAPQHRPPYARSRLGRHLVRPLWYPAVLRRDEDDPQRAPGIALRPDAGAAIRIPAGARIEVCRITGRSLYGGPPRSPAGP